MSVVAACFGGSCGCQEPHDLLCVGPGCGRKGHRSCAGLKPVEALAGDVLCGFCRGLMGLRDTPDDPASEEQRQASVLDGCRSMMLHLRSMGVSTAAACTTLLNKVRRYEETFHRQGTLSQQVCFEDFLTWLSADLGQAPSAAQAVFSANKLTDGQDRSWLQSEDFRSFTKSLARRFGRKPTTAAELTVEHVHAALELIEASSDNPTLKATSRVLVLLLFLGAFRVSEAAGDQHGIKALRVFLSDSLIQLSREDSKTKGHEITNYVAPLTQSGLNLTAEIEALCEVSGMELADTTVTMRGRPVAGQRVDYCVAQLWFNETARPPTQEQHTDPLPRDLPLAQQVVRDRMLELNRLLDSSPHADLTAAAMHLRSTAKTRAKLQRHPSERFLNVWGGTKHDTEQFIAWAASIGVTLRLAPGPLLRSTRAVKSGARGLAGTRVFTHMPLTTAGATAAGWFRAAAALLYVRSGMSATEAARRARNEGWTSHCARRGITTEILSRLAKFKAEHPEEVLADIENLVNLHCGWANPDLTSQDHYTGMRVLSDLLIVTRLL